MGRKSRSFRGGGGNSSLRGSFRGGLLSTSERHGARRRGGGLNTDGSIHSDGSFRNKGGGGGGGGGSGTGTKLNLSSRKSVI